MEPGSNLAVWVTVWLVALAAVVVVQLRARGPRAGLVLAYLVNLWLIHWPGAAIYLLPGYGSPEGQLVEIGFRQSVYAVVAFAIGTGLLAPLVTALAPLGAPSATTAAAPPRDRGHRSAPAGSYARAYVLLGIACYLVLLPLLGRVPTLTSLVSTGWNLLAAGLGLACWHAWHQRRRAELLAWLGCVLLLPFMTIATQGFLTYGSAAAIAVLALVATFYRPRWHVLLLGLVLVYAAFSLYVSYMRDRESIRLVVWGEQSATARVDRLATTLSTLEGFDVSNAEHLLAIDDRLNQNRLVGAAVEYLDSGLVDFARGDTLWQAVSALVPRALWPDKPVTAGSPGIVSYYTGVHFDAATSVGIGHVMEFYVNFGTPGVVLGFLVLGLVLSLVDRAAGQRLSAGDWPGFTLWFLPGFNLLQVGGSLVELTASAGAACVTALLVNAVLRQLLPADTEGKPAEGWSSIAVVGGAPRG